MTLFDHWPQGEAPREKLIKYGASSLTDSELLAIFLRTGTKGKNVLQLAREIICHFNGLSGLLSASKEEFCAFKGLGDAKYVQLHACQEMNQRYLSENIGKQSALANPAEVKSYLQSKLRNQPNEVFAALFLNNQHQVLAFEVLFFGTINASSVHPRVVVQKALAHNSAAVIIAHNHPSGVSEPSISDIDITQTLKSALTLMDVRLLDHILVAGHQVISLAERGQI